MDQRSHDLRNSLRIKTVILIIAFIIFSVLTLTSKTYITELIFAIAGSIIVFSLGKKILEDLPIKESTKYVVLLLYRTITAIIPVVLAVLLIIELFK